jgi:RHH-type rel operon transcriptional repressor/antitoxin RelB
VARICRGTAFVSGAADAAGLTEGPRTLNLFNEMLGLRLDPTLEKQLDVLARRQGRNKSDVAREAIRRYLHAELLPEEARRQSLLVSGDSAERDANEFLEQVTDRPDES